MVKSKFDKDEGCRWMCYQYTLASTVVYYVDYILDMINGVFLVWPQDILHYFLFVSTLPIRLLGSCWDTCWRQFDQVGRNHHLIDDNDSNYISRFGVMLTDTSEEKNKGIWEWDRTHFCMVKIKVQRWDSLKTYADTAVLATIVYLWCHALSAFKSDDNVWFLSFVRRIYDTTGYDIDMSDMTFLCVWPFLRVLLQITRRVYLLWVFVKNWNADYSLEKKYSFFQLLFGCQLRPQEEILYSYEAVDIEDNFGNNIESISNIEFKIVFNQDMVNYELALIKFFCTEATFLKFRRNYRDWGTIVSNHMSLHKDVFCWILALAMALVYNFLEEPHYTLEYLTLETCDQKHGRCTGDEVLDHCWCAVNLIWDIPTLLALIAASVISVIGSMRAVMVVVFSVWLQQKSTHTTWCVTTDAGVSGVRRHKSDTCSHRRYPMVLPDTASISAAFFGYAKEKNWRDRISQMKENKHFLTINEINEIFSPRSFYDVTHDIKYYLLQGTTSFRVVEKVIDQEPILLVKGEWRGGLRNPESRANRRNRYDAIQIVNVFHSEDGQLDWQRKQVRKTQAGKQRQCCTNIQQIEMTEIKIHK